MSRFAKNRNSEARRTQSSGSRTVSAPSASPRFRNSSHEHGSLLTPGRSACAEQVNDDGVPFAEKMAALATDLADQFSQSANLEKAIRKNIKALDFELPVGGKK